jgi:seryl-tRNA synthetase
MLFNQAIATFDSQISEIKDQIEALRIKLSQVEADRQNLLATEQMWESAISQIQAAKAATEAIGQNELIKNAKAAIDAVFSELPQLPAANTPTEATEPTEPTAPTSGDAIDTNACEVYDNWESADKAIDAMEPNKCIDPTEGVIDATEAEAEKPAYHSLSWREFLSYAKQQGINTKGKTRGEIELELLNQSQN